MVVPTLSMSEQSWKDAQGRMLKQEQNPIPLITLSIPLITLSIPLLTLSTPISLSCFQVRAFIADFSNVFSILIFCAVDACFGLDTPKLHIPSIIKVRLLLTSPSTLSFQLLNSFGDKTWLPQCPGTFLEATLSFPREYSNSVTSFPSVFLFPPFSLSFLAAA